MGVSINTSKSLGIIAGNRITPPKASGFENLKSIDLDGVNMYVNCGALNSILLIDKWSASAWVNRDSGTGKMNVMCIAEPASYHGHDWQIFHQESITRLDVNVNANNAFRNNSVSLNDDQWYHIAVVCDKTLTPNANKCKVWLDGVQLTNVGGTNMQQIADINGNFTIGVQIKGTNPSSPVYDGPWNGLIDEVALWDRALTPTEVGTVYSGGTPGDLSTIPDLTNWWRMGDVNGASGTNIPDQGSEGADGTLTNSPTYSNDVPT